MNTVYREYLLPWARSLTRYWTDGSAVEPRQLLAVAALLAVLFFSWLVASSVRVDQEAAAYPSVPGPALYGVGVCSEIPLDPEGIRYAFTGYGQDSEVLPGGVVRLGQYKVRLSGRDAEVEGPEPGASLLEHDIEVCTGGREDDGQVPGIWSPDGVYQDSMSMPRRPVIGGQDL